MRDRVVHVAATAHFRRRERREGLSEGLTPFGLSIRPHRSTGSNATDFSRYTGDWLNSRRTEIVQESHRRVISVSVFVLLLEFNRHRSKGIRILAGGRVTRFAI
jgi:hypothetical protein